MAIPWRQAPLRHRFAEFEFRERTGELCRNGKCVRLPEQAGLILQALLLASGEVVSREQLKQTLWPGKVFGDFEGGLNTAMRKLRQALGDDGAEPRYIGTLPRRGYRMLVPVESVVAEAPPGPLPKAGSGVQEPAPDPVRPGWRDRLASLVSTLVRRRSGPVRALAVLPLSNLSGNPDQDYLAASLTEQLIHELTLRGDLRVAPLAAVRSLDPGSIRPLELCRSLGVDHLVEGAVRRDEGQLRIHLRLVASGLSVWARSLDLPWKTLDEVPFRMSQCLASGLALPAPVRQVPAIHREAEDTARYLEARHELSLLTGAGLERATQLYGQVVQQDPRFAEAFAGLATAELWKGILGEADPRTSLEAAYRHVVRALELGPECTESHLALAFLRWFHHWDFSAAEDSFRRALETAPASCRTHGAYASYLYARGRESEADPHLAQAEPFAHGDPMTAMDVLRCHTFARRPRQAIALGRAILQKRPHWRWVHGHLFEAHLALGQDREAARALLEAVPDHRPDLARRLRGTGGEETVGTLIRREAAWYEAKHAAGEAAEGGGLLAYLWAAAGERDRALRWLEAAVAARDYNGLFVLRYPYWDAFQGDPRFEACLCHMGLQGDPRSRLRAPARSLA